jgi:type I restriction enzyme S subunit
MSLPAYPRTKPTTITWIGEVPEHWEVTKAKHILVANDSGIWGELGDESDTMVLRSTEQTVDGGWAIRDPAYVKLSEAEREAGRLVEGDLVVTKSSGSEKHIGKTSYVNLQVASLRACYSNFNQRLRTDASLFHSRLLYYVLNNPIGREQLIYNSNTTTGLANLNGGILGEVALPLPPFPEQTHIARYLTYKTALIDAYLARKRRMMALLKEQRQALISQAVTKSLDPNAPMKDSGVEWIGEVPEHWEVKRIKHLGTIDNSGCWGADEGEEAGLRPVSTTAHLTMDGLWLKDEMPVRWFTADEIARYEGRIGDIIIVKSSGSAANIISGKAGIIGEDDEGMIFSNFLMRIRPTEVEPLFLYYFLTSHLTRERIEMMVSATTYPNLKVDEYFNHLIPLPDRKEQQAIVAFISDKLVQINDELTRIQTSMERVREYRQALISAVVTGKVDVRGVEVPEIDQTMSGSDDQTMEEEFVLSSDGTGTETNVDGIAEL